MSPESPEFDDGSPPSLEEVTERLRDLAQLYPSARFDETLREAERLLREERAEKEEFHAAQGGHASSSKDASKASRSGAGDTKKSAKKAHKSKDSKDSADVVDKNLSEIEGALSTLTIELNYGDKADASMVFCPWRMVYHYPEWFIGKANGPRAKPFFEKFYEYQAWDFFYMFSSDPGLSTPVLFVPTEQFETFLSTINAKLNTQLTIPAGENAAKFSYSFTADSIRPAYLGRVHDSKTREMIRTANLPEFTCDFFGDASADDIKQLGRFLHEIVSIKFKRGKKPRSDAKQIKARADRKEMMFKFQVLVGFKPNDSLALDKTFEFDADKAAAYPLDSGVVLISLDVEAHEGSGSPTEVGIAILDTEKTKSVAPGNLGENWWPFVEHKHLRVEEFASHVNSKYVHGCPDQFNFGTSEFVSHEDLLSTIRAILTKCATSNIREGSIATKRSVVLIGHDFQQEEKYFKKIGYNLYEETGYVALCADSKDLYQHLSSDSNGRSLTHVLLDLGIDYSNLHNAGNDAAYTLRAAIACAVKHMQQNPPTDTPANPPAAEIPKKVVVKKAGEGFVPGAPWLVEEDEDGETPI